MATLVLATAGAALGAGFGGTVLGLSGAVIGRALGATLGRAIDQRLLGGSEAVEVGRIDRLRLTGAGEGAMVRRLWGKMRISGQAIWSSPLEEHATTRRRGGKGGGPKVSEYSYSISLALGLCEGEILGLGRIWADGEEIEPDSVTLRLYPGSEDQLPDPCIEVFEGAGQVPAFRGLAYVVFEDLDLGRWGNRVPQFTFEVARAAQGPALAGEAPTLDRAVQAVAMIPGTGEYALATTPVTMNRGLGRAEVVNRHVISAPSDFTASLDQLVTELPRVGSVSLVVSWFGDDLRCGHCTIRPKVEQKEVDGAGMPWRAGGITRAQAGVIAREEGRSIYGGTPSDQSVIEAIRAIRDAGREVMFHPFILMEQLAGNGLPDPWTGAADQPALPWRGRITTGVAPGRTGTSDRSAGAGAEVAAFFGAAQAGDFTTSGNGVGYHGPAEWGFRRFILHYAHLCAAAGGVDAFCLGSELRGLTRIRGAGDSFPAVAALRALAAEVRAVLGPGCRLTYAADWSEYGSHAADGNLYFPLDALWADANVDFVGIDNYMPLADWRDGADHADAHWESPYSLGYLKANIAGGEGFDWFYDSPEGEAAQRRLPITDGDHGEPWVHRVKDLRGWWSNPHHARTGAMRAEEPTEWVPMSKPIVFTEYGCAAIDKGANQPNLFVDARSSESSLPRASNGRRDDLMQMQYLRAVADYWGDVQNNPVSPLYAGAMVDMTRAHAWAWDARPYPAFPAREDLWSDGPAWTRGHWLNGRATSQPLSAVLREVTAAGGVGVVETARCHGLVRGYVQDRVEPARATLQPLMLAGGVDAVERDGMLHYRSRMAGVDARLSHGELAVTEGLDGRAEHVRAAEGEVGRIVRVDHVDAAGAYEGRSAEARDPGNAPHGVAATEVPLSLTAGEGRAIAQRWLAETGIARDGLRLALPLSRLDLGPGDRVALGDGTAWRIERAGLADALALEAVRVEGGIYEAGDALEDLPAVRPFTAPVAPEVRFLDLPLMTGEEVPHAPHVAVAASPWQGPMAVWAEGGAGFSLNRLVTRGAVIGVTESAMAAHPPGLWDRGPALRVRLAPGGALASASEEAVLNGANGMAIGDGTSDFWEVFQFRHADVVAPDIWDVSLRLRGQLGTDGVMPPLWPEGSQVVLLDAAPVQIELAANARGLVRRYRIGLNARGHDRPEVVERFEAFAGIGLRPYPVAHLAAVRQGGDIVLHWIRRTRIEGDNWQQVEVPLGEESEAYILRIIVSGTIRREEVCPEPLFAYGAAMQAADGAGAGFVAEVAQLSARFGPGPFRRLGVAG